MDKKLPAEITAGIKDVAKRGGWNKAAATECALPTETWREVVARRQRYEEVRKKLAAGEVRQVNDFITLNLDLRQFAQDVIQNCEGPDLLMAFWQAITSITVLDPTGGSGAFIFAAQMINFTIPGTGSSGHMGGGMLLSILLGPYAAFLVLASVLTVQALFFADGGLLAWGCNVLNMGFFTYYGVCLFSGLSPCGFYYF